MRRCLGAGTEEQGAEEGRAEEGSCRGGAGGGGAERDVWREGLDGRTGLWSDGLGDTRGSGLDGDPRGNPRGRHGKQPGAGFGRREAAGDGSCLAASQVLETLVQQETRREMAHLADILLCRGVMSQKNMDL